MYLTNPIRSTHEPDDADDMDAVVLASIGLAIVLVTAIGLIRGAGAAAVNSSRETPGATMLRIQSK
jgi:hypothetical protein